jgi:hypothetical protein
VIDKPFDLERLESTIAARVAAVRAAAAVSAPVGASP